MIKISSCIFWQSSYTLLQGGSNILCWSLRKTKWRWSFYSLLLAEDLSRYFSLIIFLIPPLPWHWYAIFCSYSDEWTNFLERVKCENEEQLRASEELEENLCLWASYRGQTLTKTGKFSLFFNIQLLPMYG